MYLRSTIPILIIATILIGCNNDLEVNENLVESRINPFILKEDQNEVDLNALTDFSWEKAYIFTPYTTAEDMTEKLGFNWRNTTGIDYRDDMNLIVFVKGKKMVKYMELSRKYGDFDTGENEITPKNAIVTLE